jgi:hypothetical protein
VTICIDVSEEPAASIFSAENGGSRFLRNTNKQSMLCQMTEDRTSSNNERELPVTERTCVCVSSIKALLPEWLLATATCYEWSKACDHPDGNNK